MTATTRPRTDLVVARHVARRTVRAAVVWGAVFGLVVYSSLAGFASAYPTAADRRRFGLTVQTNVGFRALFGAARRVDTPAGFTAWRSMGSLVLVGGIWGLLVATRVLRGDEEAGRWETLLAGATTRARATAAAVLGLAGSFAALYAVTAVITVASSRRADAGFSVPAALYFALALTMPAVLFAAVGAVCAQLAATRRQAATIAGALFGAAFLLRLIGDAERSLSWVRWTSPLGWVEELRPLGGSHVFPLLLVAGFVAAATWLAVSLSRHRDLGASVLPDRDVAEPRLRSLGSPLGLAARVARPAAVGWVVGVVATGFVLGLVAKGAGDAAAGSKLMQDMLARLGGAGAGARLYLGLAFLVVTAMTSLAAAGHIAAARDEEAEGRLDHLLARPVTRVQWLAGRLAVAAVVVVVLGLAAGVSAWLAAASQHAGVGFGSMLEAGLNAVPAAFVVLGAGALADALVPRSAAAVAYGLVAWSFLIELIGTMVTANRWLLDLSVFHHLPPVPAADPRWSSAAALVAVGLGASVAAAALFRRRDITSA